VVSEAVLYEFLVGGAFITTKNHCFDLFNELISIRFVDELSDETWASIPLSLFITRLIPSGDIRDQLETIAYFQGLLKELRVEIGPCKFGRILQNKVDILLETHMVNVMEVMLVLVVVSWDWEKLIINPEDIVGTKSSSNFSEVNVSLVLLVFSFAAKELGSHTEEDIL
jgi:hypothetical protein